MPVARPLPSDSLLVVCLCADWCSVCRDYRATFEQMQQRFPQARFMWIDIEDESDLLDPLEVEDFPTLLLAAGAQTCFFGVVAPQAHRLERLILAQLDNAGALAPKDQAVCALVARLRARMAPEQP